MRALPSRRLPILLATTLAACATLPPAAPPGAPLDPPASAPKPDREPAAILPESSSPVTFEDVARFPEPGWQVPRSPTFSPDGAMLTFLMSEDGSDAMSLFALDIASGSTKVLVRAADLEGLAGPANGGLAQELRDERQRNRLKGISSYQWAREAPVLLIPAGSELYLRDAAGALVRLTNDHDGSEIDPKICADGRRVAFARGSEVAVLEVATKKTTLLTKKAPAGVTRGQSDFNAQEEFDEPSGLFFSPDCEKLVYLEVDESAVGEVDILGFRGGAASFMRQRYPQAGNANPHVTVHVADLKAHTDRVLPLPATPRAEAYLGRFRFTPDSKTLVFQALARSQRRRDLLRVELGARGELEAKPFFTEQTETGWVDPSQLVVSDSFAYTIVASGNHAHLARVPLAGGPAEVLTTGNWDVTAIAGLREDTGSVYVVGTRDDPIGRMLYEVTAAGDLKLLTPGKGTHATVVDGKTGRFVDVESALDRAPVATLHDGARVVSLPVPAAPDLERLRPRVAETLELTAADGATKLYGALLAPRVVEPDKSYPLVVMVYGGPGVQMVTDRFSPRLFWQHLADRGFFVLQVDNRGSAGRGPTFERAIAGELGRVELADQLAALEQVLARYPIDPARVAIYGHSYGGFMAALAMLRAPGRFASAVAGAPVTDWRLYDTGYTERYMDTPAANPTGYAAADLENLAGNLTGQLMLVHALMDENVHFQNTADLADALMRAGKNFDMFVYPGERHGVRSPPARAHLFRSIAGYLVRTLDPAAKAH
ncbi:MAG: alpha/beta fold hydrolase [Polyangiaceae bacterium]